MFFRNKNISPLKKLEKAIRVYVTEGKFSHGYSSIEGLKKDLYCLSNKEDMNSFSHSLRVNDLPQDEFYSVGHAFEKFSKDVFTSGIIGGVTGGVGYFSSASFLFMGFTGGSSFLLSTSLLFLYRIHQKSVEGYEKICRFDEIFSEVPPTKKNQICPRLSPFS